MSREGRSWGLFPLFFVQFVPVFFISPLFCLDFIGSFVCRSFPGPLVWVSFDLSFFFPLYVWPSLSSWRVLLLVSLLSPPSFYTVSVFPIIPFFSWVPVVITFARPPCTRFTHLLFPGIVSAQEPLKTHFASPSLFFSGYWLMEVNVGFVIPFFPNSSFSFRSLSLKSFLIGSPFQTLLSKVFLHVFFPQVFLIFLGVNSFHSPSNQVPPH